MLIDKKWTPFAHHIEGEYREHISTQTSVALGVRWGREEVVLARGSAPMPKVSDSEGFQVQRLVAVPATA